MENGLDLSLKLKLGNGEESSNLSHPFTKSSLIGRHFSSQRRVNDNFFMLNGVDRRPFGFPIQRRYPGGGLSSQQMLNITPKIGIPMWDMDPRMRRLNQEAYSLPSKFDMSGVNGKRVAAEREAMVFDEEREKKKLRLTVDQCAILERTFAKCSTINNKEKRDLAIQLALKPKQVEVWFQNRRARTKLKQTKVDSSLLKKSCEELSHENKRLHKQIQELRSQLFKAGYLGYDGQESQPMSSVSFRQFL